MAKLDEYLSLTDFSALDGLEINKKSRGDWIDTYSGRPFFPLDPKPEEINILDIAHALSMICRFNGQCNQFYSVAEHSVRSVEALENIDSDYRYSKAARLHMLLHDGSEAYICDIPRPIKPSLTNYAEIEFNIQAAIFAKFSCSYDDIKVQNQLRSVRQLHGFPSDVKQADLIMLATEARDLGMNRRGDWGLPHPPLEDVIIPYTQPEAKRLFLAKFKELTSR